MDNLNKQLILDLYSKVFGQTDVEFAELVIAENYIQHNPMVKTGKVGFMEFLSMLKQVPKTENPKKPFLRFICDNNFVAVHSQIEFMGKENATIDLYRIENGLISEHWDAVQEIIDSIPKVIGTVELDETEKSSVNKRIIDEFINKVLIKKQADKSAYFFPDDITLSDFAIDFDDFQLHRLIGEQNFVLAQSEVTKNSKRFVQYDIFRLSKGLIVEHWSVKQMIPDTMAHSNGMI